MAGRMLAKTCIAYMLAYNREQVRYLTLVRRFDNMVESKEESDVVAKISMLRLTIGSGMLRLSSCMLSIGRGPKCEQGNGGQPPPLP